MKTDVVNFRCDSEMLHMAKKRASKGAVRFPDLLRLAVKAIAENDTQAFNDVIAEIGGNMPSSANSSWLYHKCHELFIYRNGTLLRKGNKGAGIVNTPVDVISKGGVRSVIVLGKYYPVKDIVWLMFNGKVSGDVVYIKHNEGEKIENLAISDEVMSIASINYSIDDVSRDGILSGKLRALIVNCGTNNHKLKGALERLFINGKTFHLVLDDGLGWRAVRAAIYAERVSEFIYVVSIS